MREDTTGMSAEVQISPVIPAVMISTGVVSPANPPVSGQQVTFTATARQGHHDARTLLVMSTSEQISPFSAARTVILGGLPAAHSGGSGVFSGPGS